MDNKNKMESEQPALIIYPDWPTIRPGEPYLYFNNTFWAYVQIIDLKIVVETLDPISNQWIIYKSGSLVLDR